MRKLSTAIAAAALLVSAASAARTPETITFEARPGNVVFPHRLHAARGCKACHEAAPAKFKAFDKDKAHALCKGCHDQVAKGPRKCDGCHKR